ncbi:hypothetical protein Leryth_026149 [Lithospermum erythrorhizon]|nr:hypothetical protein Leryth_026149 [Lithospermum erythrorhizon]
MLEIMGAIIAFEDPTNVVVEGKLKKIQRFTFVDMEHLTGNQKKFIIYYKSSNRGITGLQIMVSSLT